MTSPSMLTTLPFELLREIALSLDKASLKALRLACVHPRVSCVTSALLFETITLRLGTLEWTTNWAQSRFPYLYSRRVNTSQSPGIFADCRTLCIDTRYPFVVTVDKCLALEKLIEEMGTRAFNDTLLDPLRVRIPELEQGAFFELLRGVCSGAKKLHTIDWRSADDIPLRLHKDICGLLLTPLATRQHVLKVSISVTTYGLSYLDDLAHVDFLAIRIAARHPSDYNVDNEFQAAGDVVKRCPDLRGFEFYSKAAVFTYETSEPLRAQLNKMPANSLEVFKADSNLGFTHGLDWSKLQNIKQLWVSGDNSITYIQDLTELFTGLEGAGTRLDKLSIENYNQPIHDYLLTGNSLLTELELWGFWKTVDLGVRFWEEVVPRHAPTLRHLMIHNLSNSNKLWGWPGEPDEPGCPAKKALQKCRNLENLTVSFSEGGLCYLTQLIENLVPVCRDLHTINLVYDVYTPESDIDGTRVELQEWSSTSKIFDGRALTLRYEDLYKGCRRFPRKSPEGEIPALWFDGLLQTWKLVRDDGVYRFERQNDVYLADDQVVWMSDDKTTGDIGALLYTLWNGYTTSV
ncbi:hypothetical protein DRE_00205 [Drechslerella stenobrocha 248]|uniref:F-box domain-containing protein n=1 Tax=Drechslerella stenobrocha 248 TaxID=1043628 RepID=W7IHX9_9PEZI|nr:hypothetical protein DRE_00205 [Drechslerella stenobrocha 248]